MFWYECATDSKIIILNINLVVNMNLFKKEGTYNQVNVS